MMKQIRIKFLFTSSALAVAILAVLLPQVVGAIARGYSSSDATLKPGEVVALKSDGTESEVERISFTNADRMLGVVTSGDQTTVTISSGNKQVLVENEGSANLYVSDINGPVKKGDLLAVSSIKGVLEKASKYSSYVVAIAQEDADLSKGQKAQIDIGNGNKEVSITLVNASLDQKAIGSAQQNAFESSLSRLGASVSGKQISEVRVLVGLVIFVLVLIVEGGVIYGAVSSAIFALGRNPMARKTIVRELIRVAVFALIVLALGVTAIYIMIWL